MRVKKEINFRPHLRGGVDVLQNVRAARVVPEQMEAVLKARQAMVGELGRDERTGQLLQLSQRQGGGRGYNDVSHESH